MRSLNLIAIGLSVWMRTAIPSDPARPDCPPAHREFGGEIIALVACRSEPVVRLPNCIGALSPPRHLARLNGFETRLKACDFARSLAGDIATLTKIVCKVE
jgi:hypothetical protein